MSYQGHWIAISFNARKVRKVVISEKRPQVLNNTFVAPHGFLFPVQWTITLLQRSLLYAIGPDGKQSRPKGKKRWRILQMPSL